MRVDELSGKKVIDSEAQILGEVSGIDVDLKEWSVDSLYVRVDDDSIEALGMRKPRVFGKVEIRLPVTTVNAVSDLVSLKMNHKEIRELLEGRTEHTP